jgi:hypothetical protein
MKANQEVLDKLAKILRLAQDKGAQPGEVEAAMAKAKEIAMRHSIELASVDLHGADEDKAAGIEIERVDVQARSEHPQQYHRFIVMLLSKLFGISVIRMGNRYAFIGEVMDVAICKALWPWLEHTFRRTYCNAANEGVIERGSIGKNNVYAGLYRGIVEANRREEAKLSTEDKSKWALVVVNKDALVKQREAQEFPNLRTARARSYTMNAAGRNYGYAKGKQINLRQVGHQPTTGKLN